MLLPVPVVFGAKRGIHVLIIPLIDNLPRDDAGLCHAQTQRHIRENMEVTIKTTSGTVEKDLSQPSAKDEVVETLKKSGWIIIKGGATISCDASVARDNKYAVAILPHANERFRYSTYGTLPPEAVPDPPVTRPEQWKDYANNTEIVAVATFHLQGDPESTWKWGYDKCLKGEQLGDEELVYPSGGDLIICNAWLARRLVPKPQGDIKLNFIYVNYAA